MAENVGESKTQSAQAGQVTPPVPVSSAKCCIGVNSNPQGAAIQLDCKDMQMKTPGNLTDVDPGTHTVGVSFEGCPPIEREVTVTGGSPKNVFFTIMTKANKKDVYYIIIWTFILFVVAAIIAILNHLNYWGVADNYTRLIIYCACAGIIGGTTFNIYELVSHLGVGDLDLVYFWWYMARPFIGLAYGTMIFLLVAGGLMTLSGISTDTNLSQPKTMMFYIALAFLAGYAEEPVSIQIKAIAEALFKKPDRPDSSSNDQAKKD